MRSRQEGIVLLSTLTVLTMLTLLVLSQLQMNLLFQKALNQQLEAQQDFYQLEAVAYQLLSSQSEACHLEATEPNELLHLLKNHQGCVFHYQKKSYFYQIENLGVFPCLQVAAVGAIYSSRHRRLSLMAENLAILQIRVAETVPVETCEDTAHFIKAGILSWRYLT